MTRKRNLYKNEFAYLHFRHYELSKSAGVKVVRNGDDVKISFTDDYDGQRAKYLYDKLCRPMQLPSNCIKL